MSKKIDKRARDNWPDAMATYILDLMIDPRLWSVYYRGKNGNYYKLSKIRKSSDNNLVYEKLHRDNMYNLDVMNEIKREGPIVWLYND